jgi:putative SOS response-associated peptidase YedK
VRVPSGRILCGFHLQFRADPRRRLGRPLLIGISDGSPFALTGLLERWRNLEAGEAMQTFTIMTTPNELWGLNGSAKRTHMPTLLSTIRREPAFN